MADLRLDEERAIELAEIFRMLGDPNRLRIAVACLGEPLCVGDVAERVGLSTALVSHHLRVLRAARFLVARKRGKQVFYVATDERVRCILEDMVEHVVEPAADPEEENNG
ncbi:MULTISPECIES: ArsR/SmtB family transcription factor [Azospirillum]|uniref:ArsR family transcriptional regulator n=1 Tax=Azospirillum brasilense TaxID=192 RepID=A0A6L3B232_AZOBR|nr:metalloregulator ArsR/SmtB family transcription factor [Azospirillum brasilense]KAA0686129.1 ArsR family transcriptional regulator [Azospirillum brasilense]